MFQEGGSDEVSNLQAVKWKEPDDIIHKCTLKSSFNDLFSGRSLWLRKTTVSKKHPLIKKYFSSRGQIEEAIKRHINGPYWYMIHPLSDFNVTWNRIMLIVHIINWYVVLFQIANADQLTVLSEIINFVIQCPCYVDIALRFLTGTRSEYDIFLNQRAIVKNYLKFWFFADLITSIPFQVVGHILQSRVSHLTVNIVIIYQALKILTFNRIRNYFGNSFACWDHHYLAYMISLLVLYSLLSFHLATCIYQTGANLEEIVTPNLNDHPLNNIANIQQYPLLNQFWYRNLYCVYMVALKFYCFSFVFGTFEEDKTIFEISVLTIIIIGAYIYHLFLLVKVIAIFQYRHSSKIRYQEIMNQLEQYMRAKRLPLAIKKSLVEFYQQRYQYRFFKEKSIQNNLSESLRRELTFHCGQLFINRIGIFDDIPLDALSNIVSCLKPEIYMPNDLITKAGTVGDCMYFIASGTVSIRATTGQELLHLEDGDCFGEVSLFTKNGKRVTNTVAIEYCELYRLDKSDYEAHIAIIPELANKFKALAMKRMNATISYEQVFRNEQNKKMKIEVNDETAGPTRTTSSTSL